jgi:uncharacterized membrane protein
MINTINNNIHRNTITFLAPFVFAIAAFGLRILHLDYLSIWYDEGQTALDSTLAATDLWTKALTDKPPLYYQITSLFWSPGQGEFHLRLPAAILGSLVVFFSWYVGKAVDGLKGAILFSFFMAISSINIKYSQEARQYILVSLGWLLMVYSLYRLVETQDKAKPQAKHLIILCLGSFIMVQTHLIAIHYIVSGLVSYFFSSSFKRVPSKYFVIGPILACCLAIASLLPWLIPFSFSFQNGKDTYHWLSQPDIGHAAVIFVKDVGGGWHTTILSIIGMCLYTGRKSLSKGFLFLGLLVIPPVLIWVSGYAKPMYLGRTIMPGHIVVIIGLVLLATSQQNKRFTAAIIIFITLGLAYSSARYYKNDFKEDWRGLAQQLKMKAKPSDVVLIKDIGVYKPLYFYLHEQMPNTLLVTANGSGKTIAIDAKLAWPSKCFNNACEHFTQDKLSELPNTAWLAVKGSAPKDSEFLVIKSYLNNLTDKQFTKGLIWKGEGVSLTPYYLKRN